MGKVLRTAFRILGLDERRGRWVVEQDFHGNFLVNVTWFFVFFSGVLDWIVLILMWFERSIHSEQVSGQSYPWPLKLIMPQVAERRWILTGGYRWLRGKWVNLTKPWNKNFDEKDDFSVSDASDLKEKNLNPPSKSRTYDLLVTSPDALPPELLETCWS